MSNFTDEKTAALMIHFASLNPNSGVWISGNFLFERNQADELISQTPILNVFMPNIYYSNLYYVWLDILRLTLAIVIIMFYIYRFFLIWK